VNARWILAPLLAASVGSASALPAQGLSDGVLKKTLPNGMTLLVKRVASAPVVAVNAWVRVGSVQELDKERGITHFIEHMLFKGTAKMKVGELDRLIKSSGGYNNAHTRYESTDFIDVMPADKLDIALSTMADALRNSAFDDAELQREREVVLEELHRAQDNPSFEAWNRLTHLAFVKHPYMYPVIGYKEVLQKMDRQLLVDYWKRWYRPQNIIVVVVGDIDAKAAAKKAAEAFSGWPASKTLPVRLAKEPAQTALRSEEATGDIQTTLAVIGLPSSAELDADTPALDMALSILGQGLSSRLNQEVREKQKLVHSVAAGQFNGAYPGLAYLWAELEPAQVKPALQAVWAQVERMKAEPVSAEEIQRQRIRLEHDEAAERMSMEGMAGKLGYYEALGGDYREVDAVTERMRQVSAADIQRVMKKYFKVEKANVVVYRPEKSKATGLDSKGWEALLRGVVSPSAGSGRAPAELVAGGVTRFKLSSGGTLLVKPAHHTPLVAAQLYFPSGQLIEPAGVNGGLNLLARTLQKGLPGQDAAAIADAMDDLGLAMGPSADADRMSFGLQALSSRLPESLALAGRVLREATLPAEEVAKERERVLKDIKDKTDSPDDYVADLFNTAFFGAGHPYGRPIDGEAATVKKLDREALLKLRDQALRPEKMVAVVVGDVEPETARRLFEAEFGAQKWAPAGKAVALPKVPALKAGPRRSEVKLAKNQAHLVLGWPAPTPLDPDYAALRLVNSVLGEGMDSRLFTEVRDKRGLCYSVYSTFDRRLNMGSWRVYVGTRPETLKQAEAVCREVVAKVAKDGISAEELAGAKAYAKGIFKVARQDFGTDARVLANYESWGLGAAEVEKVAARLDAVTLEDCKRVAKKWLKPDSAVVAVVKP
jgi:zinc protease